VKILATYNIKGGVGKTATTVNLAYLAAMEGARVLVWDLDPQGAATYYFRVKPKVKGGAKSLLRGKSDVDDLLKATDYENLDLLPADFSYRHMDLHLDDAKKPMERLKKLLKPLEDDYDYVFLDCPPSISLVSENVFSAADGLIVPIIPTTLSLRTLDQLMTFRKKNKLHKTVMLPFFSMSDRRRKLHRDIMDGLPAEIDVVLKSHIPNCSDVELMGLKRAPLPSYTQKNKRAVKAYKALWKEIKGKV